MGLELVIVGIIKYMQILVQLPKLSSEVCRLFYSMYWMPSCDMLVVSYYRSSFWGFGSLSVLGLGLDIK